MIPQTISEIAELLRKGQASPLDLVRDCLEQIDQLNPTLNAFITVTAQSAMAEAKQAEREIAHGNWRGPLHGIPIGLKDLIDTAGVRTTAGSAVFRDRIPAEDAAIVKELKAAGAVLIGKQNLHEFAYGGSSLISHFGPVRNPAEPEFIAGGSSGGSAAAVASGMCYAAIGTDTAGSIREPAALCGVLGFKPSYGLVSTQGIIPLSISLDHAGPITRTAEDAAILLDALTRNGGKFRESVHASVKDLRVGVPRNYFFDDVDSEILSAVEPAIHRLAALAKSVRNVECSIHEDRTVFLAESHGYHRERIRQTPELYDPETLRRIQNGADITETQYRTALADLQKIRKDAAQMFRDIDILMTPTVPIATPRIAGLLQDLTQLRPAEVMLLRNTRPINVWGLPAISVPCGKTSEGLPIGLQIIGPPKGEEIILRAAYAFEQSARSV